MPTFPLIWELILLLKFKMIKIELEFNAINFILQTLGELPTKTGAWELVKMIKDQTEPQIPKAEKAEESIIVQ